MAVDSLLKVQSLFDGHQLGEHVLFRRCAGCDSSLLTLSVLVILHISLICRIDPLQRLRIRLLTLHLVLHDLAHLRVKECVSDYHFFFLQVFLEAFAAFEREVIEVEG